MPAVRRSLFAFACLFLLPATADANERHFTYTYESAVLPVGAREIEIWTTSRTGKEDYFVAFDERLEFEVGLTDRLMTAFYLNWSAVTADVDPPGARQSATEFTGVSSEWKLKLMDPVAAAFGLALYGELTGGTDEAELEGKLIIDKQIGDLLLAGNLVLANEWELEPDETETEQEIEIDLAAAYFLRPGFSAGLELRNHNDFHGDWEHSALFLGPVLGYGTETWWAALSILPQLPALKKEGDGSRVLDDHEKLEARILFSFHLD
jgi:hypothetical protein